MMEYFYMLVLAPIVGLLMFIALAKSHPTYLRSLKEMVAFFFWPHPPRRMLIVREIDGTIRVFYDDDYEVIKSRGKYMVKTKYGEAYISMFDPDKACDVVSMYDARGPRGYPSPMGIAVRWIISAAFTVFIVYSAVVSAWFPSPKVVARHGGVVVAKPPHINPWVAFPLTMVFVGVIAWFLVNIMRFNDRSIEYGSFISLSIEPPFQEIYPALMPDSKVSPAEVLKGLGRELKIVVAESIKKFLDAIKDKVGSEELAAAILSKMAMTDVWRSEVARILDESRYVRKAGETIAALRFKTISPRVKISVTLAALLVGVIIGFIAGFVFGSSWAVVPATNLTKTKTPYTPTTTPQGITPAPMPAPPIATNTPTRTISHTVTPARPPSPP